MDDGGVLTTAAEALRAWVPSIAGLSPRELITALQDLERLSRAVEAALVTVVDTAERSGAYTDDGHASVKSWCRASVRWSDAQIAARVRCARLARSQPQSVDALLAGRVGVDQALVHANPRVRDHLDDDVTAVLLTEAARLDFADFRVVARRWEQLTDVDGATRDDEIRHSRRDLQMHWVDGALHVRGRFAAAQGAWVAEVFDAFCHAEWEHDWAEARTRFGDEVGVDRLERSPAQRRADALWAICGAAAVAPPAGVVAPTVNIVIDAATFEQALTTAATNGTPAGVAAPLVDITGRRSGTLDGINLIPADVLAAALVGHVRRVVINADSVVIDQGRRSRLFTGSSREAIWIRRMTCIWVGCRSRHCQIDHTQEWSNHGGTDQHNGQP
jgi:hypothetical protein